MKHSSPPDQLVVLEQSELRHILAHVIERVRPQVGRLIQDFNQALRSHASVWFAQELLL